MNSIATLAVGTEITDGQISDRNSQWLSSRAVALGYEVVEHRSVPDESAAILRALIELSGRAKTIFVTGGLGPTSDDITRDCVAKHCSEPLEWHEASWLSLVERLSLRGAKPTENQKQQCFYPRGADILKNSNGTANGFIINDHLGVRIVTLPGPPNEIAAIWRDGLERRLELSNPAQRRRLTLLRTMGLGEGALAHRVEEIIDETLAKEERANRTINRPLVGYRAHTPYVEIKLWATADQIKAVDEIAAVIRREFSDILINEGSADIADLVINKIVEAASRGGRVTLADDVTQGAVVARLFARAQEKNQEQNQDAALSALANHFTCVIGSGITFEPNCAVVQLSIQNEKLRIQFSSGEKWIELPRLAGSFNSERGRKWVCEYALREWGRS